MKRATEEEIPFTKRHKPNTESYAPLETLPCEIFNLIAEYLSLHEVFGLVRCSKTMQSLTESHISIGLTELHFRERDKTIYSRTKLNIKNLVSRYYGNHCGY